ASNLVKIDREGKVIAGEYPVNTTGFVIHGAIHEARPDALCIIHSHAVHCVAVSSMQDGLLPLSQFALRFHGQTAVHEYGGGAREMDERPRLIRDLGDARVLLMRNHGVLVTGRSVAEAFFYMYYLDQACRIQVAAMSCTDRLVLPSKEICDFTAAQQSSGTVDMSGALVLPGERDWPALRRLLDRESPGYRD
ncbi:MAG: class II aldolase/adducin family protein, partial [Gammaproteobacteria bacterium]|nr:class II aldolase/adducin family protein [Gammaproteobacteria bacterium]